MNDHAARHLVTTALHCVGAPTVAALCECDYDCACVVLADRKKKRVGASVGKRKVKGKKSWTRPPTLAPHTTNPRPSDDPELVASPKTKTNNPISAPTFVGCVSTLIVLRLMDADLNNGLTDAKATFLALRIHADTGSLCFESTTPSDAKALAWLMDHGASQAAIADQARAAAFQSLFNWHLC